MLALPKNLWVELINFACYLQNKGPSKALVQITPSDVFFGNKLKAMLVASLGP
jgi:hypothetical protein